MKVSMDDGHYIVQNANGAWYTAHLEEGKNPYIMSANLNNIKHDGALGKKIVKAVEEFRAL